mmetsp:Transcript_7705/g.14482  ORF Transcript_7705/g.14482 Transcript_7705/m.14482 type:complete len:415 (+) Transcript_7705:54-1298(+)
MALRSIASRAFAATPKRGVIAPLLGLARVTSAIRPLTSLPLVTGLKPTVSAERNFATITYSPSEAKIGKPAPTFKAGAVVDGEITEVDLADYRGKWTVLLFYPKDFTFVCPTEIIAFSDAAPRFKALNAEVLALSTDTEESHLAWIRTPRKRIDHFGFAAPAADALPSAWFAQATTSPTLRAPPRMKRGGLGHMQIPIVADVTKAISADYGVLLEDIGIALRGLFLINPEGVLEQITVNNLPVGRSVDETLRLLQAFQFVAEHGEVCPANWKPGEKTMIPDPEGSLAYFETGATEDPDAEDPLAAGKGVVVLRSPQDYYDVIKEERAVVDFVAPWCGKCRQIMPFVNKLAAGHPGVTFAKFDTTEAALSELSAELGVKALPAFRFFKNGQPSGEVVVGYKKKPLQDAVEKLAGK